MTVGVFFAFMVERTDMPFKSFAFAVVPLTIAMPGLLYGIAWVLLLSPRIGLFNLGLLSLFGKKTTAVMTNVPGPREKLKLLGSTLEQSMFWVPQSGDIGLGISILSYAGQVQFGLIADHKRVPDPAEIAALFHVEFESAVLALLLGPWPRAPA